MKADHRLTKKLLFTGLLVVLLLLSVSVAGAADTAGSSASPSGAGKVSVNDSAGSAATNQIIKGTPIAPPTANPALLKALKDHKVMPMHNVTTAERFAAALEAAALAPIGTKALLTPVRGGTPDYFGPYSNYANSQLPTVDALGNAVPGTGIRKFVDSLPGLSPAGANNLGQYIPVATSDTLSYAGDDFYEIAVVQYTEKMHSDIAPTVLRGYVQLMTPNITSTTQYPLTYPNGSPIRNALGAQVIAVDKPHYLGPVIVAQRNKPVRVKFHNYLPTGTDGNLFIPVDTTVMGAGVGPDGVSAYKENRATLHLHGGTTPWISDGTPHQWTTPAGENTPYPEGVSTKNVPDMDNGNEPVGTMTFYYTNQQGARLQFYHDHAYGITRLNVYAGEAGGYIIRDAAEQGLIANGTIPSGANEIPLIIQDKTFVPDAVQLNATDPTWNWGNPYTPWPHTGDLWYPHVYMPIQKELFDINPMGRWDYGPWVGPPYMAFKNQPVANPYYDPINAPWEPQTMPAAPNPSQTPESFMDTSLVNGAAYPYVQVGPHAYRFRILNACNDRTLNLQLYYAGSNTTMWSGTTLLNGSAGEVPMVPANVTAGFPASWPTDGRDGGVPDPAKRGPSWIRFGTEGGLMPAPEVVPPQPVTYDYTHSAGGVLNMLNYSLLLMPAQRADVIVDFSGIPTGTKLILYSDAPAPSPGGDSRYDYFTGDPNQTLIGGAPTTLPGYGPNTRTIMQFQINSSLGSAAPYNLNALNAALPGAYALYQDKPLVPETAYNAAFNANYANNYANLANTSMTFTPAGQATPVTLGLEPKAIIGDFEMEFGRLTALLGTEIRATPNNIESRVPSGYIDPPTEVLLDSVLATQIGSLGDGTQIWRIVNNDVDLHPVHWHMFTLQVVNRVRWDGVVIPPDADELGWRETINTPPLMDTIVALRPITPSIPFELPNSIRPLDVTRPIGTTSQFGGVDPTGGQAPVTNHLVNFGWEYVWHCHILGHEENDFMHPMAVAVTPKFAPAGLTALSAGPSSVNLTWTDTTVSETNWTIQRAAGAAGPWSDLVRIPSATGPQKNGIVSYIAPTAVGTNFYRVLAVNIVGDTTVYPNTAGYPFLVVNSTPSNVASTTPVGAVPFAKFSRNVTSGRAPLSVRFGDQSTGVGINMWNWSFGDGTWYNTTVAAQKNPTHVFTLPGVYNVRLTVCNATGCNTTIPGQNITATAPAGSPVAAFTKNKVSGVAPLSVIFTDTSTGAGINKWNWSFGDGTWFNTTVAAQKNPTHVFTSAGVYTVQLTVSNAIGTSTTVPGQTVTVTSAAGTPVAAFTKNKVSGVAPLSVIFTDTSTGTGINKWNWSFGDGTWFNTTVAAQKNPTHVFTSAGVYTVQLTVSNAAGSNTTIPGQTVTVTAVALPFAKFSRNVTSGLAPLAVRFGDQSTGTGINKWNWSFGDGTWWNTTIVAQKNPTHIFSAKGVYNVRLTVSNTAGSNTTIPGQNITAR